MAIAGLNLDLLELTQRKANLENDIFHLQSQKNLALYSQSDKQSLQYHEISDARRYYKEIFETLDSDCGYVSYEEMPDYKEMVDMINARYQEELSELQAWEANIDEQLTTKSAELEEIKAWKTSYQSMLQANISEDFQFGLNQ